MKIWQKLINSELKKLAHENLLRKSEVLEYIEGMKAKSRTNQFVSFTSNDYLGMSRNIEIVSLSCEKVKKIGMGERGSPLLGGYTKYHEELEEKLAKLKSKETALLFSSGYLANIGVITSLAGREVSFFSDRYNHASIYDGLRISKRLGAKVKFYRHNDVNHLEQFLKKDTSKYKVVITETLFSMDGDIAPLRDIIALKKAYNFLLVVDEAHATLIFGERGAGVAEMFGVEEEVDINVGTLSKAFGSLGGFAATSKSIKEYLTNKARSYIFSTSLPLPVTIHSLNVIDYLEKNDKCRKTLWENIHIASKFTGKNLDSQIVPIIIGEEKKTILLSRVLKEKGYLAPPIRYPTVPKGKARLRISLTALHKREDIIDFFSLLNTLKETTLKI